MKNFILGILFLLNFSAYAQNTFITGKVYDENTNLGVEYANIVFLRNDSSFIGGTISDSAGKFEFCLPEPFEPILVQITNINYQKKLLAFSTLPAEPLMVALVPSTHYLNEIIIASDLKMVKNTLLHTSYLITDSMRNQTLLTTHLLEGLPNIYVDFNDNIFIGGSNNVLILRNGVELSNQSLINQIPPQAIERIEVSKTVPTKYLTRKYSSVLNIITKRIYKKSFLLSSNVSPNNNLYDASANINIEENKHTFYLYYKYYYRNFKEESQIENFDYNSSSTNLYNFTIKPRKEQDNEIFTGYSFYPSKKYIVGIDGYLSFYNERQLTHTDETFFSNYKDKFTTQYYKVYLQKEDSLSKLYGEISFTRKNIKDRLVYQDSVFNTLQDEGQSKVNSKFDYSKTFKIFALTAGIDYNYIYNTEKYAITTQRIGQEYKENNFTAYTDFTKEFKNISLNAGINMYTYLRKIENKKVKSFAMYPKISAMHQINPTNSIKVDYFSYLGTPTLWQMLSLPIKISPTLYSQGNPYLKPEIYNHLSSEFSYSKGSTYLSSGLYILVTKNKIQEKIIPGDQSTINFTNLNKRYDYGINLSLNFNLTNFWKVRIYGDLFYRNIPDNEYFQKHMWTFNGSILSSWTIARKIILAARYQYNGNSLIYNGELKSPNTSIAQLRYNICSKLNISLLVTQPVDAFKTRSVIYNSLHENVLRESKISVRTFLLSFTYNIFNDNTKKQNKIYYNEDKRY